MKILLESGILVPNRVPISHLRSMIHNADSFRIPLSIYIRMIKHESEFDSCALNESGAFGYCQLLPSTFDKWSRKLSIIGKKINKSSSNNLLLGAMILRREFNIWKKGSDNEKHTWELAVAAYEQGDLMVKDSNGVPFPAKNYVKYIMYKY